MKRLVSPSLAIAPSAARGVDCASSVEDAMDNEGEQKELRDEREEGVQDTKTKS
jgi:hypothetical protein